MKCSACSDMPDRERRGETETAQGVWIPGWRWHVRVAAAIYAVLLIAFLLLNVLLKPYMRSLPEDVTPWLKDLPPIQETVG